MAMNSDLNVEENHVGIKVKGDLGDFKIVEEIRKSEDEEHNRDVSSRAISTLSLNDLVKPSAPVIGSVAVSNSENVQFGNNTYFNGPVTIKQVVNNSAHDNPGYQHTEVEETCVPVKSDSSHQNGSIIKKFRFRLWLKLTISAISVIVVAGVCAILSTVLSSQSDINSSSVFSEEEKVACTVVAGVALSIVNIRSVLITLFVVLLTFLWFYVLLTHETIGDKGAVSGAGQCANPLLISPNHLRIVPRSDWLAQPVEQPLDPLVLPAPWVIISHTAAEGCSKQSECVLRIRTIQMFHMESRKWFDIGYNFLVAGDGSAYCGRGWDAVGAHTLGYNRYSIGITFVGTFNKVAPPQRQLDAAQKLIRRGVELGKIAHDYKLFAHRQLASTLSPGDRLFEILKTWPHFVNESDITRLVPNY